MTDFIANPEGGMSEKGSEVVTPAVEEATPAADVTTAPTPEDSTLGAPTSDVPSTTASEGGNDGADIGNEPGTKTEAPEETPEAPDEKTPETVAEGQE